MICMDIAAMSIAMNAAKLQQAASLAMVKKTMNLQEQAMGGLIEMMQQTPPPSQHRLDVRA
ncbi:MAG: YjfB family protein [Angelakisella sp.]